MGQEEEEEGSKWLLLAMNDRVVAGEEEGEDKEEPKKWVAEEWGETPAPPLFFSVPPSETTKDLFAKNDAVSGERRHEKMTPMNVSLSEGCINSVTLLYSKFKPIYEYKEN